jgi:nucleoside 2-deoxyribosyltransferase
MDRLRCFVAMRFDELQTDKVYDRFIKKTLKRLRIVPIRVDRVQHNDNVDAKIIREIEDCDMAIADLTFARPSVYFEAGYAQRLVQVIYTCRKDHFKFNPKDVCDNLRVHFDLQMKPIIRWRDEDDSGFAGRLEARIRKVVRPLLRDKAARARKNDARLQFARFSVMQRSRIIEGILQQRLRSMGFRKHDENTFFRSRKGKRDLALAIFGAGPSISRVALRKWFHEIRNRLRATVNLITEQRRPTRVVVHWIICTLSRTPPSKVHEVFTTCSQDQSNPFKYGWESGSLPMMMARPPVELNLYTVDGISSEDDCKEKVSAP